MTRNDFASLGSAAWALVVAKRQKYNAANDALFALMDQCQCDRSCKCHLREQIRAANRAVSEAYEDRQDAEQMWHDYCQIRKDDIRTGERVAGRIESV